MVTWQRDYSQSSPLLQRVCSRRWWQLFINWWGRLSQLLLLDNKSTGESCWRSNVHESSLMMSWVGASVQLSSVTACWFTLLLIVVGVLSWWLYWCVCVSCSKRTLCVFQCWPSHSPLQVRPPVCVCVCPQSPVVFLMDVWWVRWSVYTVSDLVS